jgi:hypothetical protein
MGQQAANDFFSIAGIFIHTSKTGVLTPPKGSAIFSLKVGIVLGRPLIYAPRLTQGLN